MSRAYKDGLCDLINDLGGTTMAQGQVRTEKMSGADLAQALLAVKNGDTAVAADVTQSLPGGGQIVVATKTLGANAAFAGSPNSAALSGADQERFTGTQ